MKRIASLLLCAAFVCSAFFGCAKGEKKLNEKELFEFISYTYDSAYSFEDSVIRTYNDLCEAVVKGDKEVRMNEAVFDDTLQLFYTSFPLNYLVEGIQPTDAAFAITYKFDDHAQRSKDFIQKIHQISVQCENENETAFAVNLYNYIASSVIPSKNSAISCYETVMTGEGTSFSYANMFEYILQQRGINAYHILCEDENGNSAALSAAKLDGELYYFDVFKEYLDNKGKLLKYFGLTSAQLDEMGCSNTIYTNRFASDTALDSKFEKLGKCKDWKLDKEELLVTLDDGKVVHIAL